MSRRRNRKAKRGVVLLIVISLLVLFVLIAVTFAIVAGQYKHAAQSSSRAYLLGDDPAKEADLVMYQLLRDSTERSAIFGHSLLEDMYGKDFVIGTVQGTPTSVANGQFVDITYNAISTFSTVPDYYCGSVFTVRDGTGKGISTRVVQFDPLNNRIRIENLDRDDLLAQINGSFIINGKPFNGTGFGYAHGNVTTPGNIDASWTISSMAAGTVNAPTALLPNFGAYYRNSNYANAFITPPAVPNDQYDLGGADESWDTFDFQNMILARVPPGANASTDIDPSFHRRQLINYWMQTQPTLWTDPQVGAAFRRMVMARPSNQDHPNFTGSNPAFDPINGPWDVDNDNDGVPDSIWIDPGLPVLSARDGRRYKRLVAVMVQDLDGRINVNAHGSWVQDPTTSALYATASNVVGNAAAGYYASAGAAPTQPLLPRGLGVGPAEICPLPTFGGSDFNSLLKGRYRGRTDNTGMPGASGDDVLSWMKQVHEAPNYAAGTTLGRKSYATPSDFTGIGSMGVDYLGVPLYARMGLSASTSGVPTSTTDDPYEIDLVTGMGQAAVDSPYTYAELERVLRFHDPDAGQLPDGLLKLRGTTVPTAFQSSAGRRRVTVGSYHVPAPNMAVPREIRLGGPSPVNPQAGPLDLIYLKILKGLSLTPPLTNPQKQLVERHLRAITPIEMRKGQMFDLNRWFGNGDDNDSDGVVDEMFDSMKGTYPLSMAALSSVLPQLLAANDDDFVQSLWNNSTLFYGPEIYFTPGMPPVGPTLVNLPAVPDRARYVPRLSRQLYARHLYCLLMALRDDTYQIDFDQDGATSPAETARGIAQWAVNVVDFRDADSAMTAFEYDENPFNGWDVDGDPRTNEGSGDRRLVWGIERPELLLTEAIAMHDRRTEDLTSDPTGKKTDAVMNPDDDFDQRLVPRPSLFLELYHPWASGQGSSATGVIPSELTSTTTGISLNKVGSGGTAVWRIALKKGSNATFNPDQSGAVATRSIYFTGVANIPADPQHGLAFWTDQPVGTIQPGRYAIVGSSGQATDNAYAPQAAYNGPTPPAAVPNKWVTPFGRLKTAAEGGGLNYANTRRIEFQNAGAFFTASVEMNQATNPEPTPPNIQSVLGVVINKPRSLNLTDPNTLSTWYSYSQQNTGGGNGETYSLAMADGEAGFADAVGSTTPLPFDQPFDVGDADLMKNATTTGYAWAYLQRLADPDQPWDATSNPYLTIDSMPIDLTAFNGASTDSDPLVTDATNAFRTVQRGQAAANNSKVRMLWSRETVSPALTRNNGLGDHIFDYSLIHSLGFLNSAFGTAAAGTMYDATTAPVAAYAGAPALTAPNHRPFPWLYWNNRPFASPYELLQVPCCSSFDLLTKYSTYDSANSSPYQQQPSKFPYEFGHLLNFFHTATTTQSNQLYRLFDFVETPSAFVATERWYNRATSSNQFGDATTQDGEFFRPPFNRLSRFRDPGRVNLNTIQDVEVWQALTFGFPEWSNPNSGALANSWLAFQMSRAGKTMSMQTYPTDFANPFRAATATELMPNVHDMRRQDAIEGTLMRSSATVSGSAALRDQPLFGSLQTTSAVQDATRNSQLRYQGLQRLANLTSTHSNVYAVWITVGYFEVTDNNNVDPITGSVTGVDAGHPDGLQLGREIGEDSGTTQRHRAFYIIDRSIPVAYEPGVDHNVDRAVVLRRLIE